MEAKPRLMPKLSSSTLATVARQFGGAGGVGDQLVLGRIVLALVDAEHHGDVGVLGGRGDDHLLGPSLRGASTRSALSRKMPVDSTTMSTRSCAQGERGGILHRAHTDLATIHQDALPFTEHLGPRLPCTESCLRRWASVLASARSLTATTSTSVDASAARKKTRPIRPNPLTPTALPCALPLRSSQSELHE